MGRNAVVYTNEEWIDKEVCIIPLPIRINDRVIETYKTDDGHYELPLQVKEILHKTMKGGGSVGRCYIPHRFIGFDMLIIEAPTFDYFD